MEQPVLDSKDRSGSPSGDANLVVDVLDVMPHGLRRDPERRRHLTVRAALRQEAEDFDLAIGQVAWA